MLEAAMIIGGVINGPIIGVFSAGMLLLWINSVGVLGGFLGSILISTWKATEGHLALYDLSYIWYSDRRLLSPCVGRLARWLPGGCSRRIRVWWEAIAEGEEEKVLSMKELSTKM